MSRQTQRVALARAYVLHQQPYRDSSLIVEIVAREHGRLTVFARAARGPKSRFAALQAFQQLLLSWSGRGEAAQLTGAEIAAAPQPLPPARLMSAFYLNELLMKLTVRHDPHPELFDCYDAALVALREHSEVEPLLRRFEKRLLELIGYGLQLRAEADGGRPVQPEACYSFRGGYGVMAAAAGTADAVSGRVLLALAAEEPLTHEADMRQARTVMRAALDHCLEGRELRTRTVAQSMHRREYSLG
ncbi:MAG: DNA repair protein RecO [Steroidobacterales bacterium]